MKIGRLKTHTSLQYIALILFAIYVALFPGSTITSALNAVPPWGVWMGPALLLLQGAAACCWIAGRYGRRGVFAGAASIAVAWLVEHLGETTGFPFGAYHYTDALQPQVFGVVPLPIMAAWLMVALGAWQIARLTFSGNGPAPRDMRVPLLAATLVVVIDLQIETVATLVNPYWGWVDTGSYYGVPSSNFIAWWFVGLAIALILERSIGAHSPFLPTPGTASVRRGARRILPLIPALFFILSSVMFTVVNFAHGYMLAGFVGMIFLAITTVIAGRVRLALFPELGAAPHPTAD